MPFQKEHPTDHYRERVMKAKKKLPISWRGVFWKKHPEFDTEEGRRYVSNVYNLLSTDIKITEYFESMAVEHQAEQKKLRKQTKTTSK